MPERSAKTGRYVKKGTERRRPASTVVERTAKRTKVRPIKRTKVRRKK